VYAYSCQHFELSTVITNSAEIKRFHETMVEDAPDRNEPTSSSAFRQTEDTMAVEVDPNDPTKNLRIGTQLPTKYESVLIDFLHAYHDAFAWKPSDMLGTLREVAEHELRIMLGSKPMHQRLRHFDYGRCRAISEEIAKLLAASFIKEVYHSDWLANPVLVKKKNGKWRMCVDYTGLNKACPKDHFPLPRIEKIIDSTSGCEILYFLDAYSGYHQNVMKESDQLATFLPTPFGTYCCVTMPCGLKNAGATYQRCMQRCFADQINLSQQPDQLKPPKSTVAIYVDDVVVKAPRVGDLTATLDATFANLRRFSIKINPEKCTFRVPKGKLLGYIVSKRDIETNSKKIMAIATIGPIRNVKSVQKLTSCLATLSQFIS
jgi:hypothetical protein